MISCLCEYKALVNAYKREITEKSHLLFVNGYVYCLVNTPPISGKLRSGK